MNYMLNPFRLLFGVNSATGKATSAGSIDQHIQFQVSPLPHVKRLAPEELQTIHARTANPSPYRSPQTFPSPVQQHEMRRIEDERINQRPHYNGPWGGATQMVYIDGLQTPPPYPSPAIRFLVDSFYEKQDSINELFADPKIANELVNISARVEGVNNVKAFVPLSRLIKGSFSQKILEMIKAKDSKIYDQLQASISLLDQGLKTWRQEGDPVIGLQIPTNVKWGSEINFPLKAGAIFEILSKFYQNHLLAPVSEPSPLEQVEYSPNRLELMLDGEDIGEPPAGVDYQRWLEGVPIY